MKLATRLKPLVQANGARLLTCMGLGVKAGIDLLQIITIDLIPANMTQWAMREIIISLTLMNSIINTHILELGATARKHPVRHLPTIKCTHRMPISLLHIMEGRKINLGEDTRSITLLPIMKANLLCTHTLVLISLLQTYPSLNLSHQQLQMEMPQILNRKPRKIHQTRHLNCLQLLVPISRRKLPQLLGPRKKTIIYLIWCLK
jgi:hypothetical protein